MVGKTVSLVLGSGGARGLAHIGVIHWLEENGYNIHSMTLLDGGILNPVPIAPTFEDDTDLTIAINLGGAPAESPQHVTKVVPKEAVDPPAEGVHAKISNFVEDLKKRTPRDGGGSWKMLGIANQTFDAMQGAIARQKLAAYPPDHTIMIARDACGTLEFDRTGEMITLGYETTARSLSMS